MDNGRAGKIRETYLGEPTASPYPMAYDRVDESGNQKRIHKISWKLHPLGHAARDYSGRGPAKSRLKKPKGVKGYIRAGLHAGKKPPAKPHKSVTFAEHYRIAENEKSQ
jgi:hypothetical protein